MKKKILIGSRWIAVLLAELLGISFFLSVGGVEPTTFSVRVEREDSTGRIGIYCDLHGMAGYDPAALLLEVEIPAGWWLREIKLGEGADGMTLTHGGEREGRVKVLLDGVCRGEADQPIVWLRCEKIYDSAADTEGRVGVTGAEGGEVILYVLRDGESMEEIPLEVEWKGWTDTTETLEDTTEDVFLETADPPAETTAEEETDIPLPQKPTAVFLGCRETGIMNGVYGVQFLFGGEGDGTPILCMEGGGLLYAECGKSVDVIVAGEQADFCTLWGLLPHRRYVFWIPAEGGWITVTYEGGRFAGFGWSGG